MAIALIVQLMLTTVAEVVMEVEEEVLMVVHTIRITHHLGET